MFTFVFIDWENIEKTVKQEFGSVIDYEEFIKVIRQVATSKGERLVGVQAYGDFDKGTAGLMSRLVNLGIEPKHIVTKTAKEYLKGSTDIELSLDVLETMYSLPHISNFMFVSGDSDLRYVIKRLQIQGKNLSLLGFESHTSRFLVDMVNEFIPLNQFSSIMRKVTQSEKELRVVALLSDQYVNIIVKELNKLENVNNKEFIGLNYLRNRIVEQYKENATQISEALTDCIDCGVIETYHVPNPRDSKHPTRACKLSRDNIAVKYILNS